MDSFEVTHDEVVHSWAMFRLLRRWLKSPAGETFERTYVSTPGAVACVAITDANNVVMVQQYRATFDDYVLELPAGMRDVEGEDPEVTAARELTEETGYVAGGMDFLGRCFSSPGVTDSVVEVYLATELVEGIAQPHGPEEQSLQVVEISLQEALRMVENGSIRDAKTAYGLMLTARLHPHLLV